MTPHAPEGHGRVRALLRRVEFVLAALVFVLPLLLLLTQRSVDPWVWRLSRKAVLLSAACAAGYVALLASYRLSLPRFMTMVRSATVVVASLVVVSALLSEVLLRIADDAPYRALGDQGRHQADPDLGHVFTPSHEQVLQNREWRQVWRSNAEGVRADRDYGERPDSVTRFLILGDSFTAGDQVSLAETFPGVLQALLDPVAGPGRMEVINAGVPGYGTYHAATYLRLRGARFQPDVVVLAMTPNDWGENLNPLRVVARDGALIDAGVSEGELAQWRDQQRWYSLVGQYRRSRLRAALDRARRRTAGAPAYHHASVFQVEGDARSEEQYALVATHLADIASQTEQLGASLAIILIPFREQLGGLPPGLDPSLPGVWLANYAGDRGIPFRDLLEDFRRHPTPQALYWEEDAHCNAEGYALIGRSLFDLLRSSELTTPRR
jgi:lysophospholipase L1-like esterase